MAKTRIIPVVIAVIAILMLAGCAQLLPPGWNASDSDDSPTGAVSLETGQDDASVIEETNATAVKQPAKQPAQKPAAAEASAAPSNEGIPTKTVTEGELVSFPNLKATDPDGDKITYTFTPPLDSVGKWQTKVGDAGEYRVTITASDGKNSVSQVVIVQVNPKNKPPVIKLASNEIKVKEGESVKLNAQISDPDGDKVSITYDGWMTSPTKATGYNDAGTHEAGIIASDGMATTRETITVIVENVDRAPILSAIADISVKEGEIVSVNPSAIDPDGDKIAFTFSKPLQSDGTWHTTGKDVGKYKINVTASDGSLLATTSFALTVESLNKAPIIQMADLITVDEGQTVTLSPVITDPEGDELTVTYSGWMKSNTYATTYEDSGSHLVTITVNDGINTAKKDVTVVVNDFNRPPTFGTGAFN